MTPELAATLTIHEETIGAPLGGPRVRAGSAFPLRVPGQRTSERAAPRTPLTLDQRASRQRRLLATADLLAATAALMFASWWLGPGHLGPAVIAITPLVIVLFKIAGLYDRDQLRLAHSTLDETPLLLQLTGLFTLGIAMLQPLVISDSLAGQEIAVLWAATFVAVCSARMAARVVWDRSVTAERCLIIGESARADRIRGKLTTSHVNSTVVATLPWGGDDLDLLDPRSIRRIVEELRVHRIIIAPTTTDSAGVVELIRLAKAASVHVSVLPRMLEVVGSAVELEDVDGMTMMAVRPFGLPRSSRTLKRAFDLIATSLGLLVVGPIIAGIAIAIRVDTRGPAFFRQVRVGRDGRCFRIYKFRTMVIGAEARKDELRGLNEVGDGMFKITDDPRATRVGRLLRRTSLDELPQLFNVIQGEMSLVGPRPLVTDEDAQVVGLDRSRLHLTPGMTGPWQVLGARVPMQEMVGIDYLYVANWSLWLDLKLLVRTARHMLRGGNV